MRKLFLLCLCISLTTILLAQKGKIEGKVINSASGQPLANATVILIEQSKTIAADQNGNFIFSRIAPGTYSIKCSYSGHTEKIIEDVIVKNDQSAFLTVSLDEKKSDEVVIVAKKSARVETVASLLVAQKNNASVSDGISAESIRKTPDRSTSDVLKRVSGASIQDERFAIIRGLNDRYNAAFINGAPLPSTESDRKAFAFDIFPSSILDNLVIYKTATPDKSGEFAGGIIDITTKSIPSSNFTSISIGGGYNNLITGKQRYSSEMKGGKDWLGVDDGTRDIPAGVPTVTGPEFRKFTASERAGFAKLFSNYKWGVKHGNTSPNFNFQITQGINIERKGNEFIGALLSVNYNKNFTFKEGERNSFDPLLAASVKPYQRNKYLDSLYNDETVVALLGNVSVKINNRNTISWKNNLSINTDNQLLKRYGPFDYDADSTTFVKDIVRLYTSNKIYSTQLVGEHQPGKYKTKINWLAAYSRVDRNMPVTARTSYIGNTSMPNDLIANFSTGTIVPFSGSGNMFSSKSNESIKSIKADIAQQYTFMKYTQNFIKVGGGFQKRERAFTSRLLGLAPYMQAPGGFDYSLLYLPESTIFLPGNLGKKDDGKGGFVLTDGTDQNSDYSASSSLTHFYLMNDQRFFKKFRLIYGVRMEIFSQKLLNIVDQYNNPTQRDTTVTDFLPSINLVYAVTPKMNTRLSYSETVNRPEFRELAPFLFFENVTSYTFEGDTLLKRAKIRNYDFRYEFFPGKAQLFSVSAFYKEFDNPIELIQLPNTTSQVKYNNAKSAKVYGLEAEFRALLSTLAFVKNENSLLTKFTLSVNAAYIKSKVVLGQVGFFSPEQLVTDRALQGQSPYLINGSLSYNDDKLGLSSTISVNRIGDRIFVAGTYNTADIYEKARTVIDFQVAKNLLKNKLELKFTVRDILAQKVNFYFDFDRNKKLSGNDRYFSSTNAPKVFSFTASYKF